MKTYVQNVLTVIIIRCRVFFFSWFKNAEMLEDVQKRAARWLTAVVNNSKQGDKDKSYIQSLSEFQQRSTYCQTFKVLNAMTILSLQNTGLTWVPNRRDFGMHVHYRLYRSSRVNAFCFIAETFLWNSLLANICCSYTYILIQT